MKSFFKFFSIGLPLIFFLENCCNPPDPIYLSNDELSLAPYNLWDTLKFKSTTDTIIYVINQVNHEVTGTKYLKRPYNKCHRCDIWGLYVEGKCIKTMYPDTNSIQFTIGWTEEDSTYLGISYGEIFVPSNHNKLKSLVVDGKSLSDVYCFSSDTIGPYSDPFIKTHYVKKGLGVVRFDLNHSNKIYEKILK